MENKQKADVSVGKGALYVLVIAALSWVMAGWTPICLIIAPIATVFGLFLALMWWINIRNGRRV